MQGGEQVAKVQNRRSKGVRSQLFIVQPNRARSCLISSVCAATSAVSLAMSSDCTCSAASLSPSRLNNNASYLDCGIAMAVGTAPAGGMTVSECVTASSCDALGGGAGGGAVDAGSDGKGLGDAASGPAYTHTRTAHTRKQITHTKHKDKYTHDRVAREWLAASWRSGSQRRHA